jgi:acyl-CoA:acyl-CoA alkyltransferase
VPASRIAAVAAWLPTSTRSTDETEARLRAENPGIHLPTGLIRRMTGVERVHERPDGWQASDLAVAAARDALADSPGDVDLVVFASASQDLVEPATGHIVAAKLGLTAPVMDVKNACNSVLNGLQVADALVAAGQYRRVLVASGETPGLAVRWRLRDRAQFIRSFPGYTMSDAGAAVVVEATDSGDHAAVDRAAGFLGSRFVAASRHWDVGTLPTGGSMHPRGDEHTYFDMDGAALQAAFLALGPEPVLEALAAQGLTWDDIAFVAIHQVAAPNLPPVLARLGVPPERTVPTIVEHGNLASVTLPLQLRLAEERGIAGPGDLVMLIGLAGGISLGVTVVRL